MICIQTDGEKPIDRVDQKTPEDVAERSRIPRSRKMDVKKFRKPLSRQPEKEIRCIQ